MLSKYDPELKWIDAYKKDRNRNGPVINGFEDLLDYIAIIVMPTDYHPGVIGMVHYPYGPEKPWYETFLTAAPKPVLIVSSKNVSGGVTNG